MKNLSKFLIVLLIGAMLVSASSCTLIDSLLGNDEPPVTNDPSTGDSSTDDPSTDDPTPDTPVAQDYKITFYYGFAEDATLDEDGKVSAYASSSDYTSKKGKRVSLTTAMKDLFAVDGYKIIGYSTTAWQKDGISADMDVYVLYAPLADLTITFKNPDGTVISTLSKKEGEALTSTEYPEASSVTVADGNEFIGWDIFSIEAVTESTVITALQGTALRLEAELAQNMYFKNNADSDPIISNIGTTNAGVVSGSEKSVYFNNGTVVVELTIYADKDTTVLWGIYMWHRDGVENKPLFDMFKFDYKAAGEETFSLITPVGALTCTSPWGDKNSFAYADIGLISLKQGENVLRIEGMNNLRANVDYFVIKGDVNSVHMNAYTLTLNNATFADGTTQAKVEYKGALPQGIVVNPPEGKVLAGWTDGTNVWKNSEFIMPESDITISPVFDDAIVAAPAKDVADAGDEVITVDGVKDAIYTQVDSALGHYAQTENTAISGKVYMASKGNGVYVYIEITDDIVVSGGKEYAKTNYRNDMIEFWFDYNGTICKIQIDAFGHHIRSDEDGHAVPFANIADVIYATALVGDNNLAAYKESGEAVVSTATGYVIEFWLPLETEGESMIGKDMKWALQINSISDTDGDPVSVNGWKMREDYEVAQIDNIFTASFINKPSTIRLEAESSNYYYDNDDTKSPVVSTIGSNKGSVYGRGERHKVTVIEYTVTSASDLQFVLDLCAWHRDGGTFNVSDMFTIKVNNTVVSTDASFTCKKDWGSFATVSVGKISLSEGVNTIQIIFASDLYANFDYIELTGDTASLTVATAE